MIIVREDRTEGKLCKSCGEWKPRSEYGVVKSNPDGMRHACKGCYNAVRKLYREGNGDKVNSKKMETYYRHHECNKQRMRERYPQVRAWKLLREYGLTVEQHDSMLQSQGNGCAICGATTGSSHRPALRVDHSHATGQVRGLLCNNCNAGLGMFGDSEETLQRAVDYLQRHRNKTPHGSS